MLIAHLLLVLEVWDGKPTCRKSWAWNPFGVVGFDLGPLLQDHTRIAKLKVLITHLLLILEVYNAKPTHMKSWARSLLMLDLTFSPSVKVKRWFTGFGELSFLWIQICIGSLMRKSSYKSKIKYLLENIYDPKFRAKIIYSFHKIYQETYMKHNKAHILLTV